MEFPFKTKKMKKQILIVTFFVLAILAGTSNVFGQDGADHYSDPRVLTCVDDALHPIAGRTYVYEATGTETGGAWRFWATKDPNFIATDGSGNRTFNYGTGTALTVSDGELSYSSDDYNIEIGISDPNENSDGSIELIWTSTILAGTEVGVTPTFVVAYYEDAAGCTDNIKVWELDPLNGFTVDVLALDPDDVATAPTYDPSTLPATCFSPVESATYQSGGMVYDYGENYLYFELVAANFTNYWIPTLEIDATDLGTTQSITSYEYTFTQPSGWDGSETWTALVSATTQIPISSTFSGNIEDGVSVFVRVLIDHSKWEGIADQTLTMIVDGVNSDGDWDVVNGTGSDTCVDPGAADQNDSADVTLTHRPTVADPAMPTPNFITGDEEN